MKRENKKKKYMPILFAGIVSTVCLGGAAAYLADSEVATSNNVITAGKTSIKFQNELAAINLTDSYPMTEAFADQNVTPYTYEITNDGNVDLDFVVYTNAENGQLFTDGMINVKGSQGNKDLAAKTEVERGLIKAGETKQFSLKAWVDQTYNETTNGPIDGKTATFGLIVEATQDTDGLAN